MSSKREEVGRSIARGLFRATRWGLKATVGTAYKVGKGMAQETYDQASPKVRDTLHRINESLEEDK